MRRTTSILLAGMALVSLAACGSDSPAASTAATTAITTATTTAITTAATTAGTTAATTGATTGGTAGAAGPDVTKPCSFMSAEEMSAALGVTVTVADEGFRCKYNDPSGGWLEVELNPLDLTFSKDDLKYAKDHGTPVAGVGDEAYKFGQGIHAAIGDVYLLVEGSNLSSNVQADIAAIAATIASRIP